MAKTSAIELEGSGSASAARAPVLMVGLGRGGSGKSTELAKYAYRAISQGRDPIVADMDAHRSGTLSTMFPKVFAPASESLPDVKDALALLLNRMVEENRSAVVDFGGGDRSLLEFGKDLPVVTFCEEMGVRSLAYYVLGPDREDLKHCLKIHRDRVFPAAHNIVAMNEGAIKDGQTVSGAFVQTMEDPDLKAMIKELGAHSFLVTRLACMKEYTKRRVDLQRPLSFYDGAAGMGEDPLQRVQQFMTRSWLRGPEDHLRSKNALDWLP